MNFELIDIGQFLGAMIKLGFAGFKQEKISLPITRNKTIVLSGTKKILISSLILFVGASLFSIFALMLFIVFGIVK